MVEKYTYLHVYSELNTWIVFEVLSKLEEENIKCGIFYNDEVKEQFQ